MSRVSVSRGIFDAFARWALAKGDEANFLGAACWADAPNSEERKGRAALEYGSNIYNEVSRAAFELFAQETSTRVVRGTNYSDRTGPYGVICLAP